MVKLDWDMNKQWNPKIQKDFFFRLSRVRKEFNKTQRLRRQVLVLEDERLFEPALELINYYFHNFNDVGIFKYTYTDAYLLRARCLAGIGKLREAVNDFRIVLKREELHQNYLGTAWLDYPQFIIANKQVELYNEALSVLEEREKIRKHTFLHSEIYQMNGIRAIILTSQKKYSDAKKYAQLALDAANVRHSGFRFHPDAGIVQNRTSIFMKALIKIAAA